MTQADETDHRNTYCHRTNSLRGVVNSKTRRVSEHDLLIFGPGSATSDKKILGVEDKNCMLLPNYVYLATKFHIDTIILFNASIECR